MARSMMLLASALLVSMGSAPAGAADRARTEQKPAAGEAVAKEGKEAKEAKEAKATKDGKDAKDPASSAGASKGPAAAAGGAASEPGKPEGGDAAPKRGAADPTTGKAASEAAADPAAAMKPLKRGPALLRHARPSATPVAPPVKPGEDPPPPSPLTMDALRQDVKRSKDSGAISPDAPARTKVEQVLAEMVKTRAALRDDANRLESLTDGGGAEPAAAGAEPGPPGSEKPPQKNPLDVLAKALRGIKPDQAAPIVARIDRNLAATVLLKMPPVDAGKIMGALKPDVAAELATQIALRAKPQRGAGVGAKR